MIGGFYLSVADKPGVVRHVVDGSLGLRVATPELTSRLTQHKGKKRVGQRSREPFL